MLQEIKAPEEANIILGPSVFLAGSIEMGVAENWQDKLTRLLRESLGDSDLVIYNPRRDDWDSSWVQSIDNPQFNEQVSWELSHLESCNIAVVVFDPNTKSPITLMELGLLTNWPNKVVVVCPEGFWRKGNVDILCERYNILQLDNIEEVAKEIVDYVNSTDLLYTQ